MFCFMNSHVNENKTFQLVTCHIYACTHIQLAIFMHAYICHQLHMLIKVHVYNAHIDTIRVYMYTYINMHRSVLTAVPIRPFFKNSFPKKHHVTESIAHRCAPFQPCLASIMSINRNKSAQMAGVPALQLSCSWRALCATGTTRPSAVEMPGFSWQRVPPLRRGTAPAAWLSRLRRMPKQVGVPCPRHRGS
jgi:hypothetical protein